MKLIRVLLRARRYPVLLLPITRGPLHGFFHFFFGYVVPAFHEMNQNPNRKYALVDAEPLTHWFSILPSQNYEIISQSEALKLAFEARLIPLARGFRVKPLSGWDKWKRFSHRGLSDVSASMRRHLDGQTSGLETKLSKVLVVGRDFTPNHYAEKLPSRYGTAKRDVPNLRSVTGGLEQSLDIQYVDPATISPAEMFLKCKAADILIGQHGAALSNMFFLRPGSHVIEIAWPELASPTTLDMYRALAKELGVSWSRPILQRNKFDEISGDALRMEIGKVTSN